MEAKFGKMMVVRGKKHVFLGMDIVFNGDGTATILMKDYLTESIVDSGMDASKTAAMPTRKNLFDIDEESPSKSNLFHSIMMKILYVVKRARSDIQLVAVAFLCMRVSCSTEQDWNKLIRLLQYLNRNLTCPSPSELTI